MNAGGFIQSASDSVEQLFGWSPTELYGRNVKELIPEPRRSALDRYLDRYRHADRSKAQERTSRFDAMRKDGKVIQIALSMSRADLPVHGEPYFIGIIRDVSQQIDVGPDASKERVRLQHFITEQTRALATAHLRVHLADRLASLGTLAAGLGHDMNNVLLPVRARLNALEHSGIKGSALGHVNAVRKSVEYLQNLSDGLHFLALDLDGTGPSPDGAGTTDLRRWWGQVGMLLRKAVPRQVKVEASFPARLPSVGVAPHWLTQAMLNLIVNAGEATVGVRRVPRIRISAVASPNRRTISLSVLDNGRGMARDIQRRAFDLFFTTKPRGMGTGLGLPLVRKVVVRAGGTVDVKSVPGRGTAVVLALPAAPHAPASDPRDTRAKHTAALSIGDHRIAALATQILVGAGFRVAVPRGETPGHAAIWVATPTAASLRHAKKWRARKRSGAIILVGSPAKAAAEQWSMLGATVIDPPDDFQSIRHAIGVAIESLEPRPRIAPRKEKRT